MSALKLLFLSLWILPLLALAWRVRGRNLTDTGLLAGGIALYVVHYRDFVLGREFVFHDTLWAHHGLYAVITQWIANGYAIGWNSFLNGGEPLYMLSNYFLWAELLGFAWLNRFAGIPTHELLNLYFSYVLISFAVFCFCLFSAVLRDRMLVFYALIPVLFGGLTPSTYGQYVLAPLYLVPLALLCAWRAVTDRSVTALAWLAFFVAVSANHYLPHYVAISAGAVLVCGAALECVRARRAGAPPEAPAQRRDGSPADRRRRLRTVAGVVVLCVAIAAPAVFVYRELGGWVAPVRGNAVIGEYGQGQQPGVNLAPVQYRFLVDLPRVSPSDATWGNLAYHHSAFFVGWIPVALALYSLTALGNPRYRPWLLSTVVLGLVALGQPPGLWAALRAGVPLFHIRHLYPLALTVTLLIVMLSAFGLARLRVARGLKLALCVVTLVACVAAQGRSSWADTRYREPFAVPPFAAPAERHVYSRYLGNVPLDVEPIVTKRASAAHRRDDFVLVRSGDYHRRVVDGLPIVVGPMFGVVDRLDWSAPPLDGVANAIDNGSFETWSAGPSGVRAPAGFRIALDRPAVPVAENRDPRWVHTGAASLRLGLPGGSDRAELSVTLPEAGGPDAEFAVIGACLKSDEHVSVAAELAPHTKPPAPTDPERRLPYEDPSDIGLLHEHRAASTWDCFRRVVHLRGAGRGVTLTLLFTTRRPATVYVDDVEVRPLPAHAFAGPAPLDVERLASPDPDHLVVRVAMPRDGHLVRRENAHRGWRVLVDGRERPIERYAGTLQAVWLERGTHTLAWEFRSPYPALMWTHAAAVLVGYVAFALSGVLASGSPDRE